jgi:hypothetical protein
MTDAQPAYDPDAVWTNLTPEMKLYVLGFVPHETMAQLTQVDHQTHDIVDHELITWRDHYVAILDDHTNLLRGLMSQGGDLDVNKARETFHELQATLVQIATDTGVESDQWQHVWQGNPHYEPLYTRFVNMNDIYDWYRDNFD